MTTQITRRAALTGLSAFAAAPALAQSGGSAITMMHGFTPGANVDTVARIVAEQLSKRLGRPVVVEPRPGAGGTTSAAAVARATPDGATLTILPSGHAVSAAIYKKLPYDAVESFTFIGRLTDFPFMLVTYPDHPAKTIADVIKSAKADGKLTYGTAGNGTGMHLASEYFLAAAQLQMQHIPYRGSPQVMADLLAKRVDFQMDTPAFLLPFIADGRVRALGVTGTSRFFALPDVPTVAESGLPDYSVVGWLGLAGPAKLPADFVAKVSSEVRAILADPVVVKRLRELGSDTAPGTPDEFRKRVADDVAKWTKVVEQAKIPRV